MQMFSYVLHVRNFMPDFDFNWEKFVLQINKY